MVILPAIDLLDGKVVRLAQGKRDAVTVYSDDPVGTARRWVEAGAAWLHVVDLNGAFDGLYSNLELARHIIASCGVHVELSGGIRTKDSLAKAFDAGASRVILGTKACEDPQFVQEAADRYGHKIAVAIDARAGQVVSRGWVTATAVTPRQLARSVAMLGIETIVCTDVSRDGMLQGPNLELIQEILGVGPVRVIASGGIACLEDLNLLRTLESRGVMGAIVGKALYEGTIDLKHAIQTVGSTALSS